MENAPFFSVMNVNFALHNLILYNVKCLFSTIFKEYLCAKFELLTLKNKVKCYMMNADIKFKKGDFYIYEK